MSEASLSAEPDYPSPLAPGASPLAPRPSPLAPRPSSLIPHLPPPIPSLLRIVGSFATVLLVFSAYRLLAVPWIEPAVGRVQSDQSIEWGPAADRLAGLREIFKANDWELDEQTAILELEAGRVKVLWRKLTELGDGKAELVPYTMIFLPGGVTLTESERLRQAFVLQAPEGALLTFDGPLDLRKGVVGPLKGGHLGGPVTIRSRGKLPGRQDEFLLVTRDVDFTGQRLWTPEGTPLEFTWGRSAGRGTELDVKFLPGEPADAGKKHGMNIAGVQTAKVSHLERLRLDLGSSASLFGKPQTPKTLAPSRAGVSPASAPGVSPATAPGVSPATAPGVSPPAPPESSQVDVTCRGPVVYDAGEQALVFRDQVDVLQSHATGPSDQVNCERLAVYFARRRAAVPGKKEPAAKSAANLGGMFDLEAQRIEASGNPVVVRAPSQQLEGRGDRLEYDLHADRVVLDAAQEAFLRRGPEKDPDEIYGPHLEYQVGQQGRLGRALVKGAGRLRMTTKAQGGGDQPLLARWGGQLQLEPDDGQHVIRLLGGSKIELAPLGSLSADEIHFWVQEVQGTRSEGRGAGGEGSGLRVQGSEGEERSSLTPSPPHPSSPTPLPSSDIIPQRMLARGQVRLESDKVSGDVGELQVWFVEAVAGSEPAAGGNTLLGSPPVKPGVAAAPPPGDPLPAQHFHVEGGVLKAALIRSRTGSELAELQVEENARMVETQTAKPGDKPIVLTGDLIRVFDASKPTMTATVTGNLAHVEGRGMSMTGPKIHVNCGIDKLVIEGPGSMVLPMDRDLQGGLLSRPGVSPGEPSRAGILPAGKAGVPPAEPLPLVIVWQHRMELSGDTARFEESVVASAPGWQIETEQLEVTFTERIRLADAKLQQKPKVKKIVCRGMETPPGLRGATPRVWMKSWETENGQQTSLQRWEVTNLDIDVESGAVKADGPVHATTVRRQKPGAGPAGPPARAASRRRPPDPSKPLVCLDVQCLGPLTGNLYYRTVAFNEQVRAIYVPTDSWDTVPQSYDPAQLGPDAVVMQHCDRLEAVQMLVPVGGARSLIMQATGNTKVEGELFFGRAARIGYDEAKGLVVLVGEPGAEALLSTWDQPGDPPRQYKGPHLGYYLKTGDIDSSFGSVEINGLRGFNRGNLLPSGGGKR